FSARQVTNNHATQVEIRKSRQKKKSKEAENRPNCHVSSEESVHSRGSSNREVGRDLSGAPTRQQGSGACNEDQVERRGQHELTGERAGRLRGHPTCFGKEQK
ncbi:hypothetical protein PFISCL1PPCAC_11682, partial [Pristionchus fissidentatus]